ncbi:MAG: hypothetical protein AB1638_04730 [Nitrospirota bacterium]
MRKGEGIFYNNLATEDTFLQVILLMESLYAILALFAFTLLLNLPFGYARTKTKRFSLRWFLCIHVPIPVIFIARTLAHLDIRYMPIFAVAAIAGQILGGKLEL